MEPPFASSGAIFVVIAFVVSVMLSAAAGFVVCVMLPTAAGIVVVFDVFFDTP